MSEDNGGNGEEREPVEAQPQGCLTQFPDDAERRRKLKKIMGHVKRTSGVKPLDLECNPTEVKARTPGALLKAIVAGQIDPNLLTRTQRLPVVQVMLRDGATMEEIAGLFGISMQMVHKDKKRILRDIARYVAEYNPQLFVAWFFDQAEHHIALAKQSGNFTLSWNVVSTLARQLTEWGLVIPKEQIQREVAIRGERLVDEPIQQISEEDFAALEAISKKYAESA